MLKGSSRVCLSNIPVNLLPAARPTTQQTPRGEASIKEQEREKEAAEKEEGRRKKLMLWLGEKKAAKPCFP